MRLLFALLSDPPQDIPPWAAGGAFIGLIFGSLPIIGKVIDYLKVKALKKAEEEARDDAKRQAQANLAQRPPAFLPESLEAMVFRIEKIDLERQIRETRWKLEEVERDLAAEKSELVAEKRVSSELREEIRNLRRDISELKAKVQRSISDDPPRPTNPIRKPT